MCDWRTETSAQLLSRTVLCALFRALPLIWGRSKGSFMASHRKPSAQTYDPRTVKEHIVETPLNEEMSKSFLEYAYSVIYARALPDARDGLKPVQRRIVYQMGEMNLTPDRPYMKSARVVGEVMGKLHPHGDSAIYEAMVRLAQPFAMRLPLVDGHGNFGSLDDGPAASRYTEARLGPAALGMNADIDEDTVDFTPNYDNKLKEPTVLPAAIPNLLVNGGSGIAVGMATNLATHNLGEVVNAAKFLMAHSDATLEQLMRYVPGPDWPTGGTIIGRDGIREAYATGRGTLTTRAATPLEHVTARKQANVATALPRLVGPEPVTKTISDGVQSRQPGGSLWDFISSPEGLEKCTMFFTSEENRQKARQIAREMGGFAIVSSEANNLEVSDEGATKGLALLELGRMLGLEKSQVMACGDSENDLAMLEAVGLGVAMGNAPLAIQQKAAAVTATNDEDGVALALEKYVLGR